MEALTESQQETIKTFLTSILSWEIIAQVAPTLEQGEEVRQDQKKALEDKLQELFPRTLLSETILPNGDIIISFGKIKVENNIYQDKEEIA